MLPNTKIVYCPQSRCMGHRMTEAQLREERRALRPYQERPSMAPINRYENTDAPPCFRVRDAERAREAQRQADGRRTSARALQPTRT